MGLLDQFMAYMEANTPRNTRPAVSPLNVIDQGLLGSRIEQMPQRAEEIKQGLLRVPADMKQLGGPEMNQMVQGAYANPGPEGFDREKGMQMAMDFLQTTNPVGGLLAHTVYHGSPHKFNKFDMSKIGTGEGAQVYGRGLYMAESADVAKQYQKNLSGYSEVNGVKLKGGIADQNASPERLAEILLAPVQNADDFAKAYETAKQWRGGAAAKVIDDWKNSGALQFGDQGALYKVDIPDEIIPRMLDWDKPLSEQSTQIHDAMKARGISLDDKYWHNNLMNSFMGKPEGGSGSYDDLNKAATEYIKEQGIPGIRYLDGNSRGSGGTSNFVLFDDQLPRILEVNGKPTGITPWADDAAQKTKAKRK